MDALSGEGGKLTLADYFEKLCKPTLVSDLAHDGLKDLADRLEHNSMTIKGFIEMMESQRNYSDAFDGMRAELNEAKVSCATDTPIRWKETLDEFIYTLNMYADRLSAEDLKFYQQYLMPFILNITAAIPHDSAEKLLALHEAGKVSVAKGNVTIPDNDPECEFVGIVRVDPVEGEKVEYYERFIDCTGQKTSSIRQFPMQTLVQQGVVSEAQVRFRSDETAEIHAERKPQEVQKAAGAGFDYLPGGIAINNSYRVIGQDRTPSARVFDVAYPHIKGQRPFFAGLQQCNDIGTTVASELMSECRQRAQSTPDVVITEEREHTAPDRTLKIS